MTAAYDPNDPEQNAFLAALARGESGGGSGSQWIGFGGVDLSKAVAGAFGFPQWGGSRTEAGPTHAAGIYQFQPGTWENIARRFNLDFRNTADQHAGAWYLAEETYRANTGGRSLNADLDAGEHRYLEDALANVWPSVTGNGANPGGLVQAMEIPLPGPFDLGRRAGQAIAGGASEVGGNIASFFTRGGLVLVGAVVVFVALWFILADNGVVQGPGQLAKAAANAATG
jgi:hypothetical protein